MACSSRAPLRWHEVAEALERLAAHRGSRGVMAHGQEEIPKLDRREAGKVLLEPEEDGGGGRPRRELINDEHVGRKPTNRGGAHLSFSPSPSPPFAPSP